MRLAVGWLTQKDGVITIMADAPCASVMAAVARTLGSPELVVFFQEKSFWEFALYVDHKLTIKLLQPRPNRAKSILVNIPALLKI